MFTLHKNCINKVLKELSTKYKQKKRFLDLGCGDGSRTVLFAQFGREICGVDRLDWRKNTLVNKIKFKGADFLKKPLPYADNFFDIVFSFDVIEHLPEPQIMLREIHRLLKNDGILIISTPNRHRLAGFFLLLLGLRKIPYFPNPDHSRIPYSAHVIEYTYSELQNLLEKEEFAIIKGQKIFYGVTGGYGLYSFFSLPFCHNIVFECKKNEI